MKRVIFLIILMISLVITNPAQAKFGRRYGGKPAGTTASATVFLLMGIVVLWIGNGSRRFKKLIEQMPRSEIKSLQPGLVKIYGTIEESSAEPFESPLLKQKCLYYDCVIRMPQGRTNSQYRTLFKEQKSQPFWLRDMTGSVLVDPGNYQLEIKRRVDGSGGGLLKDLPSIVTDLLNEKSKSLARFFALNKFVRYDERSLALGAIVLVIGTVMPFNNSLTSRFPTNASKQHMIGDNHDRRLRLYITNQDEEVLLTRYNKKARIQITIGACLIVGGIILSLIN